MTNVIDLSEQAVTRPSPQPEDGATAIEKAEYRGLRVVHQHRHENGDGSETVIVIMEKPSAKVLDNG